jgi:ribosomal protein S18 acetylase RimI-like enzyme
MNTSQIDIRRGSTEDIDLIEPLWKELMQLHHGFSPHFKEIFETITWTGRKQRLITKSTDILFEYAIDEADDDSIIGYCISTITGGNDKTGEIDSLYVDPRYRTLGMGGNLSKMPLHGSIPMV